MKAGEHWVSAGLPVPLGSEHRPHLPYYSRAALRLSSGCMVHSHCKALPTSPGRTCVHPADPEQPHCPPLPAGSRQGETGWRELLEARMHILDAHSCTMSLMDITPAICFLTRQHKRGWVGMQWGKGGMLGMGRCAGPHLCCKPRPFHILSSSPPLLLKGSLLVGQQSPQVRSNSSTTNWPNLQPVLAATHN